MTWMKLDTLVRSNPKLGATVARTGHCDAAWLWLAANTYCRDTLTDGFIADFVLPTLIPALPAKVLKPLPDVLVACGLWHPADGGYQVHDFLHHNPTKAAVEKARQKDRDRKRSEDGDDTDSAPVPSGFQPESPRSPNGVHNGSSLPRAGAPMRASSASYSSSPGSVLDPEGGLGETASAVVRVMPARDSVASRATALGIVSPGAWDRAHASHAFRGELCGWVCLPESVAAGFAGRLTAAGSGPTEARAAVLAWALGVRADWVNRGAVPGDDIFAFWRNEWQRTHGTNRPASSVASTDPLAALREVDARG